MKKLDRAALREFVHNSFAQERARLGMKGVHEILERGEAWQLSEVLSTGGTVVFPHAHLSACGHQIAAAVHACLDSGADKVLVVGVLHALSDELEEARVRVAAGGDPTVEPSWGIQGPEIDGRSDWKREFSLSNFLFLWHVETQRRDILGPQLVLRYPYLAGGKPDQLPGIDELAQQVQDGAVVVTTADPFHHGLGYGDPPDEALYPEQGGLDLARKRIEEGLSILGRGDYWAYNQHSVFAKSDARDAGQVTRYLLGELNGRILDLTYQDTTEMYDQPAPTWVATALIEMRAAAGIVD